MRTREEFNKVSMTTGEKMLEVLLDIRDALVKEYKCDVCGKTVSTPLALAGHKRSHKK